MTEVVPMLKTKAECGCGCSLFGTPKKNGHVRGCHCVSCRNRNNKRKGQSKQRAGAKAVGITINRLGAGHEENYGGALRVEVKAGAQVGPIDTRYRNARRQSDAARSIGDNRPFAMLAMPDGMSDGYLIVRTDELEAVLLAVAQNWGLT